MKISIKADSHALKQYFLPVILFRILFILIQDGLHSPAVDAAIVDPNYSWEFLRNSYDLFIADDRILPSLPKLIGKSFFKSKKQPIPVKLSSKNWAGQVQKACNATYLYLNGNSLTIRVAKASQTEEECIENIMATIQNASEKVPKKFKGIKSLFLKSLNSVALPIYTSEQI